MSTGLWVWTGLAVVAAGALLAWFHSIVRLWWVTAMLAIAFAVLVGIGVGSLRLDEQFARQCKAHNGVVMGDLCVRDGKIVDTQ